nr:MAG: hypothetical protein 1 [Leviviridae sp.]
MGNKTKNTYRTCSCSASGGSAKGSTLRWTDSYVRVGSDKPHYKGLISQGLDATGGLSLEVFKHRQSIQKMNWHTESSPRVFYSADRGGLSPIYLNSGYLNGSIKAIVQNYAASEIRKRISQTNNPFKGMTFLGELRETISMIRSPAKSIRKKIDDLYRQNHAYLKNGRRDLPRRSPEASKVLADSWLEFSFGVSPLLQDIDDAARAAAGILSANGIKRVSAVATRVVTSSDAYTSGADTGVAGVCLVNRHWIYTARQSYHVGLRVDSSVETPLDNLVARGGFDLSEVIPTAWELLPWSFFIDYFINVGEVLQAQTIDMSNIAWKTSCLKETVEVSQSSTGIKSSGIIFDGGGTASSHSSFTRLVRGSADIPNPVLRFQFPGGSCQFLNMAALFAMSRKST